MATAATSSSEEDSTEFNDLFLLNKFECWWRDRCELFVQHGYELRPRFRPGWKPSWEGTKKPPFCCEDGQFNMHAKTMDATRTSDGKRIKMKKLFKGSKELEIVRFFTSEDMSRDPRNHCVSVLDVFSEEGRPFQFMVMPLLTSYQDPPFSTVDEALDFVKQLLEGLVFMHEHGVAHRDCSSINIMMDGDPIYPKGFHPSLPMLDASGKIARPRRRRNAQGVKYYFVDFGISSRFDGTEETRLVTGRDGLDKDVPELHQSVPYDPFLVDIFILGNLFRKELIYVYHNMSFLEPLVERMTEQEPGDRPTASEALAMFNDLVRKQSPRSLRWTLIHFDGTKFDRAVWTTESLVHELLILVKTSLTFMKRGTLKEDRTNWWHL
ncbi:hypothetical protein ACEPAH_4151 [Sanghuangporus vaninii]